MYICIYSVLLIVLVDEQLASSSSASSKLARALEFPRASNFILSHRLL